MEGFERVYTVTDYYDGRRGIANYQGRPHLYESEWDNDSDDYTSTFKLSPVSHEVLQLALEDCAIWLRWETAFYEGGATVDTHPALPEDRRRHEELKALLDKYLQVDPDTAVRARGIFRPVDSNAKRPGTHPIEVHWEPS